MEFYQLPVNVQGEKLFEVSVVFGPLLRSGHEVHARLSIKS